MNMLYITITRTTIITNLCWY